MGCGRSIDAYPESIRACDFQEAANRRDIEEDYTLGEVLGTGSFAICRAAVRKVDGALFCVKQVLKSNAKKFDRDCVMSEVKNMRLAGKHKSCVELYDTREDDYAIHLIQEIVLGGTLRDRLKLRTTLCESESATILKQLLEAVRFLHDHRIAHRDIKPENLLMVSQDPADPGYNRVKLADFGLSADGASYELFSLESIRGTPNFLAPEVLAIACGAEGKYNAKVDIFSLGVLLYLMLTGKLPYHTELPTQGAASRTPSGRTVRRPLRAPDFSVETWGHISEGAQVTVMAMMRQDPNQRPPAKQCLGMSWIQCAPSFKCECQPPSKLTGGLGSPRVKRRSGWSKVERSSTTRAGAECGQGLEFERQNIEDLRVCDISDAEAGWLLSPPEPNSPIGRNLKGLPDSPTSAISASPYSDANVNLLSMEGLQAAEDGPMLKLTSPRVKALRNQGSESPTDACVFRVRDTGSVASGKSYGSVASGKDVSPSQTLLSIRMTAS